MGHPASLAVPFAGTSGLVPSQLLRHPSGGSSGAGPPVRPPLPPGPPPSAARVESNQEEIDIDDIGDEGPDDNDGGDGHCAAARTNNDEEIDIDDIDNEEVILMTSKNETDMETEDSSEKVNSSTPLDGQGGGLWTAKLSHDS